MARDPEQRREAGRKGGRASRDHGVYALESRGSDALDAEQKLSLLKVEAALETPEGIVREMRRRVAMSVMVMSVLETYLEERINAGASPEGIDIFKSWPAFQNSAMRALAQLLGTMPKPQHDSLSEEVKAIQDLVREHQETVVQGDPQPVETPQRATGSDEEGDHA